MSMKGMVRTGFYPYQVKTDKYIVGDMLFQKLQNCNNKKYNTWEKIVFLYVVMHDKIMKK